MDTVSRIGLCRPYNCYVTSENNSNVYYVVAYFANGNVEFDERHSLRREEGLIQSILNVLAFREIREGGGERRRIPVI